MRFDSILATIGRTPVGHGNAAATTALSHFDVDAFRLGALDHQERHRDLREVAHTDGPQL